MKNKLIKIILFSSFLFLLITGLVFYSYIYYQRNIPYITNSIEEKKVEIIKGETVKDIAQKIKKQGIIRNTFWFETEVWLNKNENKFQAGEYLLSPNMNIRNIVRKMTSKIDLIESKITIIEGWKRNDIAEYLINEKNLVSSRSFLQESANKNLWQDKFSFLLDALNGQNLEGYLFPDTYYIFKNAEADEIIEKILANFDKKLNQDLREEIKKQNKTIYEIIILASIVEKEVKSEKDMKVIAGIFYNRLKSDIPLQSDATITFLTNKKDPRPTLEDLEIDSAYNTYQNTGLPPGPIANPGLNAIEAVIYPENTDYFYFLTPQDGSTVFSKTLEEHNANKVKHLD